MSKNTPTASHSNSKLKLWNQVDGESFSTSLVEWVFKNGKYLSYGLLALFAILILFYRFSSNHHAEVERNYLKASNDFMAITRTQGDKNLVTENSFIELNALLKAHPELHAVYDGAIAQMLINQSQITEALPFANATLIRTGVNHLTDYHDFALITLLITTQKYQEALEKSLALQNKMNQEFNQAKPGVEFTLFAINLFRIAMLQQQLGDKAEELNSWGLWKQYAGLGDVQANNLKTNRQAFHAIIQQLAVGNSSLLDYISYREKVLAN